MVQADLEQYSVKAGLYKIPLFQLNKTEMTLSVLYISKPL